MISLFAPAKINLCLNVAAPNLVPGDYYGFHELESLVVFAKDCFDRIEISASDNLSLEIIGNFANGLENSHDNLIMRAAKIMQAKYNIVHGATFKLEKNLPIASGIGGGSSDCAAAIIGLNELWSLGLRIAQMEAVGLELGADVPACIRKEPLIMRGYGELFASAPRFTDLPALLINPLVATPTKAVYKKYDDNGKFPINLANQYKDCADITQSAQMLKSMRNDLQNAAVELVPEIGSLLRFLEKQTGQLLSRMSGSGATCFAIFDNIENAENARKSAEVFFGNKRVWARATFLKGNHN